MFNVECFQRWNGRTNRGGKTGDYLETPTSLQFLIQVKSPFRQHEEESLITKYEDRFSTLKIITHLLDMGNNFQHLLKVVIYLKEVDNNFQH